jgi:hypothetical protein
MKRSFIVATVLFSLLLAIDLWAGDPWKEKPYKDWTERDVRTILNQSPWSKRVYVATNEIGPTASGSEEASAGGEAGGEGDGTGEARDGEEGGDEKRGSVAFVVRWVSSRAMRQAWVRGEVFQKRVAEFDMEKALPPVPSDYELLVVGSGTTFFGDEDDATLKAGSYLLTKKSKQKINAIQVDIARAPNGRKIKGVIFHFPKNINHPISLADEKELKFVCRVRSTEIRVNFDLREMVDKEGIDL